MTTHDDLTLTDRYIADVARRLPEAQRADVADEIRSTISDMVDAHDGPDAERTVLATLGDPARLAHRYADRPRHLIGPEIFDVYVRGLVWILGLVAAVHVVANIATYVLTEDQPRIGEAIGDTVGKLAIVLLTTFAIVTIVAAVLDHFLPEKERAGVLRATAPGAWTVDDLLKDVPSRREVRIEAVLSIVASLLLVAVPFLPASLFYVPDVPEGARFIHPDLGFAWVLGFVLLALAMAAVEVLRLERGRTTTGVLIGKSVIDVGFAVFVTVLVTTQDVLNPLLPGDAAEALHRNPTLGIVLAVLWAFTVWDLADTVRRHRARR